MKNDDLKSKLLKLKEALANETDQTKTMFEVYYQFTRGKATKEQMSEANKQFRDLLKTFGLGIVAVLPAAPITIALIIKLGKKFGIDVVPDSFKFADKESKENQKK